jgi:hypothetical protein
VPSGAVHPATGSTTARLSADFYRLWGSTAVSRLGTAVGAGALPLAAGLGVLTYAQLCVVATISTLCIIVFNAANGAYVKSLVPEQIRVRANSRIERRHMPCGSEQPARIEGFPRLDSWEGPYLLYRSH